MTINHQSAIPTTWLATLLAALAILMASGAQARDFPQNAQRGSVTKFAYPSVEIGNKPYHMTPASKIYSQQNLIIMPAAMPSKAEVMFKLDMNGHIGTLWLLTPEEAQTLALPKSKATK